MERKTRLYNTKTRRWEWWCIGDPVRMPWERPWVRMRWLARHLRRHLRAYCRWRWGAERAWDFDPDTLTMRDRRAERRWVRLARRTELLAKVEHALTAMVQMQKFIK